MKQEEIAKTRIAKRLGKLSSKLPPECHQELYHLASSLISTGARNQTLASMPNAEPGDNDQPKYLAYMWHMAEENRKL